MKRKIVLAIFSVFFVAISVLPMSAAAAEKELKLASWGPAKHFVAVQRGEWVKEVNTALAGKFKIIEYPGGQLYGVKDMHMAVAKGSVDMGVILQPRMLAMVPMLEGAYLPFGLNSLEETAKAYSGESLEIISKAMLKKRIKLIYVSYLDPVQVWSNKKNIASVEDFKGMRLLATSPMVTKIFANLGSSPDASIPQTEQYMALKRGVSDATLTSCVGGYFQKTFEVAPFITKMNLSFPVIFVAMNAKKWDKLPKEAQDTMMNVGKKYSYITMKMAEGWAAKFTGDLAKAGATIQELPAEERAKVVNVAKKYWNEWAEKNGKDAKRLLELNMK